MNEAMTLKDSFQFLDWEMPPLPRKARRSGASTTMRHELRNDIVLEEISDTTLSETQYRVKELDTDAEEIAAKALEESLFADDGHDVDYLEEKAQRALSALDNAFALLALNPNYAPDVRGVAARLFVESKKDKEAENRLLDRLAECDQPLVRLGMLYGLEDKAPHKIVAQLMEDSHPRVRMEARRLFARI